MWAKTYPELSSRHRETVCTGGCLPDGTPIRLYPIPLRYLPLTRQYQLYQWIRVPLRRNPQDNRPESFRVAKGTMPEALHTLGTNNGWEARREVIFRQSGWHYDCLDSLQRAREADGTSLGMVKVREVERVEVVRRPESDREEHEKKLRGLRSGLDLFKAGQTFQKHLDFMPWRFRLHWKCSDGACTGHSGSVLDWGLGELARREGRAVARRRLEELADLSEHDLRLFLGNLNYRRHIFCIVGLWYPKKRHLAQTSMFTP